MLEDTPRPHTTSYPLPSEDMATIVIFGATGDLAQRKLIPGIYNLWRAGYLPRRIAVVGVARKEKSDAQFREEMCAALKEFSRSGHGDSESCDPFVGNLYYHTLDIEKEPSFANLAGRLAEIGSGANLSGKRLFYLSVAPKFAVPIAGRLSEAGLLCESRPGQWARVIFEKPFGMDLASARDLNRAILNVLNEEQVYRIDHYLGKETVQNIFAFRFGNAIYEPLFNQKYVDHVQITVGETVGMEGRRGAFYDTAGALRDVVQNHALQLLSLIAMEPPTRYSAKEIRDEKVKVLRSITLPSDQPLDRWCVRGQYAEGAGVTGYVAEQGVSPDSMTETYVALKLSIDNWRWAGVPFFIRTGKRMKNRVTEIAVQFKSPPAHCFVDMPDVDLSHPNVLAFRIQPNEAISLTFNGKPPGMHFQLREMTMDFSYGSAFQEEMPEAYERLLLDALRGDSTLFMRADEIESAWAICTRILEAWRQAPHPSLYRPGTWGPPEAARLMECCGGKWREPG